MVANPCNPIIWKGLRKLGLQVTLPQTGVGGRGTWGLFSKVLTVQAQEPTPKNPHNPPGSHGDTYLQPQY